MPHNTHTLSLLPSFPPHSHPLAHTAGSATDFQDYKYSWTDPVGPPTGIYDQGELKPGLPSDYEPCLHAFPDNETLQDDFQARHGVELLKNLSASPSQNFFVAVGFHKPHVPWYFPQRFYDYYPNASVDLAPNKHLPINVPQIALQNVMRVGILHSGREQPPDLPIPTPALSLRAGPPAARMATAATPTSAPR